MILAGLDYSITSPGLTIVNTQKPLRFENMEMFFVTTKKALVGDFKNLHGFQYPEWKCAEERYHKLAQMYFGILKRFGVDVLMLEDYSYSSSNQTLNLAEALSVLKQFMWESGLNYFSIPPSKLKKQSTGKGNADKSTMIRSFYSREKCQTFNEILGIKSEKVDAKPIDDLVDSAWLAIALYESDLWKTVNREGK